MPIVRADIPEWLCSDQRLQIRDELNGCIMRTWAREHIWVSVRPMAAKNNERTVIITVDLREGRGGEKERTRALFDQSLDCFQRIVGTKPDELILLVRQFQQNDCISGGGALPSLKDVSPPLETISARRKQTA